MSPEARTAIGQSVHEDRLAALVLEGLRELGLPVESTDEAAHAARALARLTLLLARWAGAMNLSGHRSPDQIVRRLVLDAAAIHSVLETLEPGPARSLADLGTGAGFPGLPLAILEPARRVVLVDSRRRRHHFQRAARRDLALDNVEPLHGRIEGLEPRLCDLVIAQALATPPEALRKMLAWAQPAGLVLIPGAETAPDPGSHPEIESSGVIDYRVPLGGPRRTLWWGRRRVR